MEKRQQSPGRKHLEEMKELDRLINQLKLQIAIENNMLTDTAVHYKDIQVQSGGVKDILGDKVPELAELKEQMMSYVRELSSRKAKTLTIIKSMKPRKQELIVLYFMRNNTIEKTAEEMNKCYTWTWENLQDAINEFEGLFEEFEKSV